MKTVFSNAMCAHVWAQQTQPHGRSGSMRFDGATLYSYQTPIAHIHDTPSSKVCLFTSDTYSMTTSGKHMPAARDAWSGPSFVVPSVTAGSNIDHMANAKYLRECYEKERAALMRCPADSYRLATQEGTIGRDNSNAHTTLRTLALAHHDYCAAFSVKVNAADITAWQGDADAIIERRDRILSDPKRRAKAAAAEEARRKQEAERSAQIRAENAEALAAWLRGDPVFLPYGAQMDEHGSAYLRIVGDKVETSRGASVPVAHARRVLHFWRRCVDNAPGIPWTRGDEQRYTTRETYTLGHFTLDAIGHDGSIKAGCHHICRAEIEKIERELQERDAPSSPHTRPATWDNA